MKKTLQRIANSSFSHVKSFPYHTHHFETSSDGLASNYVYEVSLLFSEITDTCFLQKVIIYTEEYYDQDGYLECSVNYEHENLIYLLSANTDNINDFIYTSHYQSEYDSFQEIISLIKEKIGGTVIENKIKSSDFYNRFYWETGGGYDTLFLNRTLSHGTMAFCEKDFEMGIHNIRFLYETLEKYKNGEVDFDYYSKIQICCSDRNETIGPMGIFLQPIPLVVSNIDLYSEIDESQERVFDLFEYRASGLTFDFQDFVSNKTWSHKEVISLVREIRGIWVKNWVPEEIKNELQELADQIGCKLFVVKSRHDS